MTAIFLQSLMYSNLPHMSFDIQDLDFVTEHAIKPSLHGKKSESCTSRDIQGK